MKINLSTFLFKILLAINFISTIKIPCLNNYIPSINTIFLILNCTSFILILFLKPKIRIKGYFKYILCYYLILFFSMLINGINFRNLFSEAITTLTTILILNTLTKEEFKKNINILVLVLEILTYINLAVIVLYPNGLYNVGLARRYYLFGHVNIAIRYLLPGCCLTLIRSYLNHNKKDIRSIIYFISVILTLCLTWPATAIAGFIIFILGIIFTSKNKKIQTLLTPINTISVSAIVSFLIIKVNIQKYFADFIVNVLHKDITFTGRMRIWETALNLISNKFILGYGRLSENTRYSLMNATSAHNQFLILLFEGGIVLTVFIFVIIFVVSMNIKKCYNREIVSVLLSVILAYFVMWIAEPFSYSGTALMLLIWLFAYRSPEFFNKSKIS